MTATAKIGLLVDKTKTKNMSQFIPRIRVLFGRCHRQVGLLVFGVISILATASLLGVQPAQAATNNTLNFQARLQTAAGGQVADGFYNIQFDLYDVVSGGSTLWTETYLVSNTQGVRVKNGYVTVNLGSLTSFPGTINWDQGLWLGITVRGTGSCAFAACTPTDAEMSPRLKLTGVPYAFRAGQLAKFNSVTGFTGVLQFQNTTGGNQIFEIPNQGAAGTYTLLTSAAANGSYIQNTTSPQTADFNITGDGTVGDDFTVTGDILQSGTGTFGTGTGAVSINGTTTVANDKSLTLGSTSGLANHFTVSSSGGAAFNVKTNGSLRVSVGNTANCTQGRFCVEQDITGGTAGFFYNSYNVQTISSSGGSQVITGVGQNILVSDTGSTSGNAIRGLFLDTTATTNVGTDIQGIWVKNPAANTGNLLRLQSGSSDRFTVDNTGALSASGTALFSNASNSATAFQVQNAANNSILTIDTTGTTQITLGKASTLNAKVVFANSTNANTATLQSGVTSASYSLTLPTALGASGDCLKDTNGSGVLGFASCGGGSGVTTVGAFSGSSQPNGATISGTTITFGPADGTNPGMVTTGSQTIAGTKTFSGNIVGQAGLSVTGATVLTADAVGTIPLTVQGASGQTANLLEVKNQSGGTTVLSVAADGVTVLQGIQPASTAANGTNAGSHDLKAGNGGNTTGTFNSAGNGGGVNLTGGNGGVGTNGGIVNGGNGGNIFLQGGSGGAGVGGGATGLHGNILLQATDIGFVGIRTTTNNPVNPLTINDRVEASSTGTNDTLAQLMVFMGGSNSNKGIVAQGRASQTGNLFEGQNNSGTALFSVSSAGAIVGVGINSGSGLIQGTGGLTVTGAVALNTAGTANTQIGNATGTFQLDSNTIDISTGGAISGVTGYTQGSGNFDMSGSAGTFATGTGAVSLNGDVSVASGKNLTVVGGDVYFRRGADYSTTGTTNDVAFGSGPVIRLTGASAQTLTGIAGGANGRILTLINAGSNAATLSNNSGSSIAANRIITGTGSDLSLAAGASISLVYDSGASLWRVVGGSGGGSGVSTVGTFSGSSQPNGATISSNTITFGPADATNPGMVSTGAQTIAGDKTLTGATTVKLNNASAFTVQNTSNVPIFGVNTSTGAVTLQDTAGNTTFVFDGSNSHLRVYANTTSPTLYADIYYDDVAGEAVFAASSGTTRVGNGTGNITLEVVNAADNILASKTVTLAGAYNQNDFSITQTLTGGSNNISGSVLNVSAVSTTSGTNSQDILRLSQSSSSATGNLILASQNGTERFKVSNAGLATITKALVKPASNATDVFQVQDASSAVQFLVDTTNGEYSFGGATATGNRLSVKTSGSQNVLNLQNSSGTTVFSVNSTGDLLSKASTASTTAFQVQNASSVALLTADSSNGRIQVGSSSADGTVILLLLDSYSTAGDPTGVTGAMYYNSDMRSMRCYANSTWSDCNMPGMHTSWLFQEDFATVNVTSNQIGTHGWTLTAQGTGPGVARVTVATAAEDQDRFGVMSMNSGTTAGSGETLSIANATAGVPSNMTLEADIATVTDNSSATLRIGLHNSTNGTAPANGIYFQFDTATDATNWYRCTANNSTRTCTSTGIAKAAAGTYQRLKFVINSAGNQVDFYIDEVSGGSNTADLPTSAATHGPAIGIHSPGTTAKTFKFDYFQIRRNLTTLR